ncbi:MAG TPA: valine--tRNA ligase [Ferruginibacter sp.]|nr:valine--tRNA ligase [Ferruginibacter sp.]HMP21586.1 valine--tRNA ligase [Ferruginibacter sp.]
MELSKNYLPNETEANWYQHWLDKGYFNSTPDGREPYTIVIPPPNVTGVLHMGHCLNNTIQDILIRRARMQGKNACWVPGTDHASIATEAKVVAMLRERGIAKSALSREEFLQYAWEWKEKYGGIILQQLKKLGCSLDWNRVSFTMDEEYYHSVIKVFIDLYNKGLIYRGKRMVNWDPVSLTALSDEEVIFKEVDSKLYYVSYPFADGSGTITVATTRPETILGDVAICVNPDDERYKAIIGKMVIVPIINRHIPVIADEYVAADFGTGALKITPAHDKNDNMLGAKHGLKAIDTLDLTGKFTLDELQEDNPSAQVMGYAGMDRFVLRKKIAEDIAAIGLLEKTEDYKGQVGTSERTGAVIENKLSMQWFVNMKQFMENNPQVLDDVLNDTITFHPAKLKNTYKYWLENIKDWCISRQLWWGQRIPAWYDDNGNVYVAESLEQLHQQQPATKGLVLKQDEDVLDTWFSSWLWPMEVFKGISNPGNAEAAYYYPSTTLVTGQDIIFFWVARMIMAGYEYENKQPFKDVYFTGMVRDKQGRKMSKQLGNSPDLLGLIDTYGADAVRFGIMIASPAGNDLLFDESSLEQGRNFNNKLWNALKLVKMWEGRKAEQALGTTETFALSWFQSRLHQVQAEVDSLLAQFRLSEALKTIYSLVWDDFCSWYLEWVKPGFEQPIDAGVYNKTVEFFEALLQLLHPFMPFITEELFHQLRPQQTDLCVTQQQATGIADKTVLLQGELLKNVITSLRDARNKNQLKPKDSIKLHIETADNSSYQQITNILMKQVNATLVTYVVAPVANSIVVAVEKDKFYIEAEKQLDNATLKTDLLKDLAYQQNFLQSVIKKLGNEKFVQNAKPEVVALEQKKKADAEARIKTIEESLAALS